MLNSVIQGDCIEVMKQIPDKSIDLVLTDPPYGTTACKWDTIIPFEPMWEQLKRVTKKNGAIVLFGSEPFSSYLRMSNIKSYKYDWVWEKDKGGNIFTTKYQPYKNYENIMVFSESPACYCKNTLPMKYYPTMEERNKEIIGKAVSKSKIHNSKWQVEGYTKIYKYKNPKSIIKFNRETKLHPTQKPVPLMEYLIKTYTNENETVLDFTAGSGTTGVACINTGRNYILIEKEPAYIEIINKRIENHKIQLRAV